MRACDDSSWTHPFPKAIDFKMARESYRLLPSVNFSSNFVEMEYFRGQHLEDAINCLHKFTALQERNITDTPLSEYCSVHPQMKLDLYCKHCEVDVCRECTATTEHKRHEHTASSDKIQEETRIIGETTKSLVELLEEMKRAISGVKEMKQRVRKGKDNNISMTREMFAIVRKAIDEREEQTVGDIKEAAYKREKALEVSYICLSKLTTTVYVKISSDNI